MQWSRLLSHTPLSPGPSRKDIAKDPVQRRHRFAKEYGQLLQTWRNSSNLVRDLGAADTIELRIQELTDMLLDEARRPLPHTCLGYAAEKHMYDPISKIAATSYNLYIIKEAVYFFGTLIDSEDDVFVENAAFAASLTNLFVRITGANSIRLDRETETKVVELAFNVTTKIRLRPDLLAAWFRPGGQRGEAQRGEARETKAQDAKDAPDTPEAPDKHKRFQGKTQRADFPLFYILMDYIHAEGKVGDFARTGLLYIVESASAAASAALEQWIVESDLSTLMATGLGALYSQLSRKLVVDHPAALLPPVLALSDYEHPRPAFAAVASCSPDFQVQLDTFLSHLLFWQDVLNHCRSLDVKSTLLEHFQVIFLQQLLYPSLLESSDLDGGSSVAVLTYLRRILESLDHPDMINLILHYLLALPGAGGGGGAAAAAAAAEPAEPAAAAARKRKSMDLATMMAKAETAATPLLFNLVDLVLACLKSHSHQTIYVTLQLVSTILRRHHRYAVITLLRTTPVPAAAAGRRSIGAHQQDVEFLVALAGRVGGQDNFDDVYDAILKDTVVRLEGHPCSLVLVAPKVATSKHELPAIPDSLPGAPRDVPPHTIRPDDPLLATILDRLETFFVNPVEVNLSITEALLDLATCGFVSLEGWFLRHPDRYSFDDDDDDDEEDQDDHKGTLSTSPADEAGAGAAQEMLRIKKCRRRPRWVALPRLLSVLQRLADQVAAYRQSVPRFDELLQQRRGAFQTADAAPPPSSLPVRGGFSGGTPGGGGGGSHRASVDDVPSDSPAARPSVLEGFAQRLLSELSSTPSRSGSPRGRKDASRAPFGTPAGSSHGSGNGNGNGAAAGSGSAAGTLSGGYGFATPTSSTKSAPIPPKEFPMNIDGATPSRSSAATARSYSPSSRDAASSWDGRDGRDGLVASQLAAFQAVDRQILARRVGLAAAPRAPTPIPLDFNKPAPSARPAEDEDAREDGDRDPPDGSEAGGNSTLASESGRAETPAEEPTVTVSHVLTNALVLQAFLLELAALVQTRAGLFDEVRFA